MSEKQTIGDYRAELAGRTIRFPHESDKRGPYRVIEYLEPARHGDAPRLSTCDQGQPHTFTVGDAWVIEFVEDVASPTNE